MRPYRWAVAAIGALFLASYAPLAHGQQAGGFVLEIPDLRNFVALGVGTIPDYMGSDDNTAGIAPAALISWGHSERYTQLLATELAVNIIDSATWNFGPVLNYRFDRDDIDDDVVRRVSDLTATIEAGAFLKWKWISGSDPRHRFLAAFQATHGFAGAHDGYLASGSAKYFFPVGRPFTIWFGTAATFADDDFMSTYFDVDAAGARRSGLPVFDADGGLHDIRALFGLIFSLSPNWHLGGGIIYRKLMEDAADSPVVALRGDEDQIIAGIGFVYAW